MGVLFRRAVKAATEGQRPESESSYVKITDDQIVNNITRIFNEETRAQDFSAQIDKALQNGGVLKVHFVGSSDYTLAMARQNKGIPDKKRYGVEELTSQLKADGLNAELTGIENDPQGGRNLVFKISELTAQPKP